MLEQFMNKLLKYPLNINKREKLNNKLYNPLMLNEKQALENCICLIKIKIATNFANQVNF